MTTTIKIRHMGPDHHNVKVVDAFSDPQHAALAKTTVLKAGQSMESYVYDGRSLTVTETTDAPTALATDARTPGQIAFEAYNASKGGITWDGKPIPGWDTLTNEAGIAVRAGWEAAARAVLAL